MVERRQLRSKRAVQNRTTNSSTENLHQNEGSFSVENQQHGRSLVTDGVIIALATVYAYLLVLSYELAFCSYFHIPYYFVSLNPTIVLTTLLGTSLPFIPNIPVLIYMVCVYIFAEPLTKLITKKKKRFITMLCILSFICILDIVTYILGITHITDIRENTTAFIVVTTLVAILAISVLFILKRKKGYSWWNEPLHKEESSRSTSSIYNIRVIVIISFFIFMIGIHFCVQTGKSAAEKKTEFPVVAQSPELVVIRSYGDYLITVPLIRKKTNEHPAQFEKEIVILKMSEKNILSLKEVGPLHAKPSGDSASADTR